MKGHTKFIKIWDMKFFLNADPLHSSLLNNKKSPQTTPRVNRFFPRVVVGRERTPIDTSHVLLKLV